MTIGQLPLIINPKKLAERNVEFEGCLAGSLFKRFEEHGLGDVSPVDVEIRFYNDEQGFRVIEGRAEASVTMTCQRCLKDAEKLLAAEWLLAVVLTEEHADKLPSTYDAYFQLDAKMSLVALVEEELLLALPSIALHEQCEPIAFEQEELVVLEKPNPFSALKALKELQKD